MQEKDKKELRKNPDRYRAIMNDLPLLICTFLPGGEISFVNQAYCDYFRKAFNDLVGTNFLQLIPESDRSTVMNNISALTVESPTQSHEHAAITPNGNIRYQRWINRAIFNSRGKVSEYQSIGEDISERRCAEEMLRESEALHRITLSSISDAVFLTDDAGYFTYICPNVNVIFGYSYKEVSELENFEKLIDTKLFNRDELASFKELRNIECIIHDKSGAAHNLLINVKQVSIKDGTRLYTCRDITEHKQAETELGQQKDFLNTLLETIPNPVFYKDADGRYTGCNRAFEEFIGKARSKIIGRTVYDLGPIAIADKYHEMDMALFEQPGTQHYEWKVKTTDGTIRDVIFDKATIEDPAGRVVGLVGVISDITERKRTEDLVRNLSHMLIEAQENERKMISYELHDCIAQNLSYLKINCDTFFDDSHGVEKGLIGKMAKQSALVKKTIDSVRDLSYGIHPPSLEQLGIAQTLFQLCDEFADFTGLHVDFVPTGLESWKHDASLEINIYRLVQEGLSNIRKHADAQNVKIVLVASHPNLILRIQDDGKGFDVENREAERGGVKRMGLKSMAERVNLLQGAIKIKSRPQQGTKIFIKIPFSKGRRIDG